MSINIIKIRDFFLLIIIICLLEGRDTMGQSV